MQVATDGTATLVSLGSRCTGLRARYGAPSYGLRRDGPPHVLADGDAKVWRYFHLAFNRMRSAEERQLVESGLHPV